VRVASEQRIRFSDFHRIEAVLREFNGYGRMNLLFSEGEHLFVYRDRNGYNGLCFTERTAPFGRVSLQDEDWEVDLAEKKFDQRGFVIATRRMTDERWEDLVPGCLKVFRDGQCTYGVQLEHSPLTTQR